MYICWGGVNGIISIVQDADLDTRNALSQDFAIVAGNHNTCLWSSYGKLTRAAQLALCDPWESEKQKQQVFAGLYQRE